ncbi:HNH endonuclease signature motif containing protein [Aspergillus alliaceus]|uniref:HNH endonuclease signature motif containing protein n=1 Tax=Petromyces alliaceus TaxID=209559 RepID=UPI0012A6DCA4|nr:uncharacterized protein BDW43DRAFT_288054 [Aspergillus alliaceus]KAB8229459.1 hypothetical protein BDW43DRAFT_288054 [Aspergillus alliaceus]
MERSLSDSPLSDAPSNVTLYLLEVNVKERLAAYIPKDANDDTFSFLQNTFQYLPTDGKANLADDIESCCSDEELQQLAKHIDTALIRPFLAVGGKSKPLTPSPRFGTEDSIEDLLSEIDDPVVREQERLRTQCLSRDGYRCVITKAYEETANPPPQIPFVGNLIAAHIIPFCLGSFSTNDELRGLGEIWQCFYRYFPGVRSRLNFTQASINDMQNVMMLERHAVHTHFGRFKLALEPTSVESQYRIWHSFTTGLPLYAHSFPQDRIITLKAQDGRYPLPSPILIETHYLIARIINATGRGEVVNDILRDYNETPTLARDGTTDISRLLSVTTLGPSLHSGRPRYPDHG